MYDFDKPVDRRGTHSFKWDSPEQGRDVIPLWVADMDFASPPAVTEALLARAGHPVYGYSFASESLFEVFIDWQKKRNGWTIERDWIVLAPGVVPSLHFAIEAYTREGDGVAVQTPVYPPFFRAVERLNRRLAVNPLRRNGCRYSMDLEGLDALAGDGVKLLLLCSPHNPVARVWTGEELRELGGLCRDRGIVIVSDDIHSDLIMPGGRFVPLAALEDEFARITVTCMAPSKTFNIPGSSCALTVIPDPELRSAFVRAGDRTAALSLPGIFETVAAEAAYRNGGEWLDALIPYLRENYNFMKNFFAERLPSIRVFPQEGTFVTWLGFQAYGLGERELQDVLLTEARVKLNAGSFFGPGGEGFQRLNIACARSTLREGLERMAGAFASYESDGRGETEQ